MSLEPPENNNAHLRFWMIAFAVVFLFVAIGGYFYRKKSVQQRRIVEKAKEFVPKQPRPMRLRKADPKEVLDPELLFLTYPFPEDPAAIEQATMEEISKWIRRLESSGAETPEKEKLLLSSLVGRWTIHEPEKAFHFTNEIEDFELNRLGLRNVMKVWFQTDPDAATNLLQAVPEERQRLELLTDGMERLPPDKMVEALTWMDDGRVYFENIDPALHRLLFRRWADLDLKVAKETFASVKNGQTKWQAAQGIALSIAKNSPDQAMSWAKSIDDPNSQIAAKSIPIELWMKSNPSRAESEIQILPTGKPRMHLSKGLQAANKARSVSRNTKTFQQQLEIVLRGPGFHDAEKVQWLNAIRNVEQRELWINFSRLHWSRFASNTFVLGDQILGDAFSIEPADPFRFAESLQEAQELIDEGNSESAWYALEDIYRKRPSHPQARALLSKIAKEEGRWLGAGASRLSGTKIRELKYADATLEDVLESIVNEATGKVKSLTAAPKIIYLYPDPFDYHAAYLTGSHRNEDSRKLMEKIVGGHKFRVYFEEFGIVIGHQLDLSDVPKPEKEKENPVTTG